MMSEASPGADAEMRPLTLAVRGFFAPTGMLPNDKLVVLKRKTLEKPNSFSLAHF